MLQIKFIELLYKEKLMFSSAIEIRREKSVLFSPHEDRPCEDSKQDKRDELSMLYRRNTSPHSSRLKEKIHVPTVDEIESIMDEVASLLAQSDAFDQIPDKLLKNSKTLNRISQEIAEINKSKKDIKKKRTNYFATLHERIQRSHSAIDFLQSRSILNEIVGLSRLHVVLKRVKRLKSEEDLPAKYCEIARMALCDDAINICDTLASQNLLYYIDARTDSSL
jgi:hypothetical protein